MAKPSHPQHGLWKKIFVDHWGKWSTTGPYDGPKPLKLPKTLADPSVDPVRVFSEAKKQTLDKWSDRVRLQAKARVSAALSTEGAHPKGGGLLGSSFLCPNFYARP